MSENELEDWAQAIANLHDYATRDTADARDAAEAVANLWSGYGYQSGPVEMQRMILDAIETGYAAALRDVRDGKFDTELLTWRPDLAET